MLSIRVLAAGNPGAGALLGRLVTTQSGGASNHNSFEVRLAPWAAAVAAAVEVEDAVAGCLRSRTPCWCGGAVMVARERQQVSKLAATVAASTP